MNFNGGVHEEVREGISMSCRLQKGGVSALAIDWDCPWGTSRCSCAFDFLRLEESEVAEVEDSRDEFVYVLIDHGRGSQ